MRGKFCNGDADEDGHREEHRELCGEEENSCCSQGKNVVQWDEICVEGTAMRHLIDFGDLPREEWDELYRRADQIITAPEQFIDVCRGKVAASLFYEPSTRTNFSFQTAMLRLGGSVFGFADPKSSSVAKGETLKDTIKMVSGYADVIVMRTPWEVYNRMISFSSVA